MDRSLGAALDYVPRWLDFQMQASQQPGCMIAIAYRDKVVLERAFGAANLATGEPLTPRHRFRVASHTKSFTAEPRGNGVPAGGSVPITAPFGTVSLGV